MVNEWVKRSLELALSPGYLDKLSEIYPASLSPQRPLSEQNRSKIRELHSSGKLKELFLFLLDLTRSGHPFPIEHPYAAILRQKPELIKLNSVVVEQICSILQQMTPEEIIRGCERPADINKLMGSMFRSWIKNYFINNGYRFVSPYEFENTQSYVFLNASNAKILEYVNSRLRIQLSKGRDFLAKMGGKIIIGEARFLSTKGGSQTRDLDETLSFVRTTKKHLIAVAVLDGIVWFDRSYVKKLSELADDEPALSAILLKDFLESIT